MAISEGGGVIPLGSVPPAYSQMGAEYEKRLISEDVSLPVVPSESDINQEPSQVTLFEWMEQQGIDSKDVSEIKGGYATDSKGNLELKEYLSPSPWSGEKETPKFYMASLTWTIEVDKDGHKQEYSYPQKVYTSIRVPVSSSTSSGPSVSADPSVAKKELEGSKELVEARFAAITLLKIYRSGMKRPFNSKGKIRENLIDQLREVQTFTIGKNYAELISPDLIQMANRKISVMTIGPDGEKRRHVFDIGEESRSKQWMKREGLTAADQKPTKYETYWRVAGLVSLTVNIGVREQAEAARTAAERVQDAEAQRTAADELKRDTLRRDVAAVDTADSAGTGSEVLGVEVEALGDFPGVSEEDKSFRDQIKAELEALLLDARGGLTVTSRASVARGDLKRLPSGKQIKTFLTVGKGDCSIHSLLGVKNADGQYECANVAKKRLKFCEYLRNCKAGREIPVQIRNILQDYFLNFKLAVPGELKKEILEKWKEIRGTNYTALSSVEKNERIERFIQDPDIFEKYLSYIGKSGTYLLQGELAVMASCFKKRVEFCQPEWGNDKGAGRITFNSEGADEVPIWYNRFNHYERAEILDTSPEDTSPKDTSLKDTSPRESEREVQFWEFYNNNEAARRVLEMVFRNKESILDTDVDFIVSHYEEYLKGASLGGVSSVSSSGSSSVLQSPTSQVSPGVPVAPIPAASAGESGEDREEVPLGQVADKHAKAMGPALTQLANELLGAEEGVSDLMDELDQRISAGLRGDSDSEVSGSDNEFYSAEESSGDDEFYSAEE